MSRPKFGSMLPKSPPLAKSRIVGQLPLQAPADTSDSSPATPTRAQVMARDASGTSNWPMRRMGTCGAIRRAEMLASAGTAKARNPTMNGPTCDHRRVVRMEVGPAPVPPQVGDQVHQAAQESNRKNATRTRPPMITQRRTERPPGGRGKRTVPSSSGGAPLPLPRPTVQAGAATGVPRGARPAPPGGVALLQQLVEPGGHWPAHRTHPTLRALRGLRVHTISSDADLRRAGNAVGDRACPAAQARHCGSSADGWSRACTRRHKRRISAWRPAWSATAGTRRRTLTARRRSRS